MVNDSNINIGTVVVGVGIVATVMAVVCLAASVVVGPVPFIIGVVAVAVAAVMLVVYVGTSDFGDLAVPGAIGVVICAICAVGIGFGSTETVDSGETGVITSAPDASFNGSVIEPGFHFDPRYTLAHIDKIRVNTQTVEYIGSDESDDDIGCITVMSKDGSQINIDLSVTYHLDVPRVGELRVGFGADWRNTVIDQAVRSCPRPICAEYAATAFISEGRSVIEKAVVDAITDAIGERSDGMVVVDSVQIKEFRVPRAVTDAVQAKLIAQQEKERAETEAETAKTRAEGEAKAAIIKAEADAEIKLIAAQAEADAVRTKIDAFGSTDEYLKAELIEKVGVDSNTKYVFGLDGLLGEVAPTP